MQMDFSDVNGVGGLGSIQLPESSSSETDARGRFRAQFWKTELCKHYRRGCRRGAACPFAHGNAELRPRPDLLKTSLCEDFARGACYFSAEACEFAHSSSELRATQVYRKTTMCKAFAQGTCRLGDACRHAHRIPDGQVPNRSAGADSEERRELPQQRRHRDTAVGSEGLSLEMAVGSEGILLEMERWAQGAHDEVQLFPPARNVLEGAQLSMIDASQEPFTSTRSEELAASSQSMLDYSRCSRSFRYNDGLYSNEDINVPTLRTQRRHGDTAVGSEGLSSEMERWAQGGQEEVRIFPPARNVLEGTQLSMIDASREPFTRTRSEELAAPSQSMLDYSRSSSSFRYNDDLYSSEDMNMTTLRTQRGIGANFARMPRRSEIATPVGREEAAVSPTTSKAVGPVAHDPAIEGTYEQSFSDCHILRLQL